MLLSGGGVNNMLFVVTELQGEVLSSCIVGYLNTNVTADIVNEELADMVRWYHERVAKYLHMLRGK